MNEEKLYNAIVTLENGDTIETQVGDDFILYASSFNGSSLFKFPTKQGFVLIAGDRINRITILDKE